MKLIITLHDFPESLYFLKMIYLAFFPCKQYLLHKHCIVMCTHRHTDTQTHRHTDTQTHTLGSGQNQMGMTVSCPGTVSNPQAISAQLTTILQCVEKVYPCPPTCLVCVCVCVCLSPLFLCLLSSPGCCPCGGDD